MNENQNNSKGPVIYAIVGVCTLIIAVVGATYAFYAASATAEISGTAGGGEAPSLVVEEVSNIDDMPLIPIDMVEGTLNNAAKGWDSALNENAGGVGSGFDATRACKDMNGYAACKIYSVTLTNNSTSNVTYKIGLTSLTGDEYDPEVEGSNNMPNIDAVAMGTSLTTVTSATSIVNDDDGIAADVELAGVAEASDDNVSETFYFMVFLKNTIDEQTDEGSFTGVVTAIGGNGGVIQAEFD